MTLLTIAECREEASRLGSNSTVRRPNCETLKKEAILCKETHDRVIGIAAPLVMNRQAPGRKEAAMMGEL